MDSDDVNFPIISSEKQSRVFACLGLKRTTAVPEKGSIHFMDRVGGRNFFSLPPSTSPMVRVI